MNQSILTVPSEVLRKKSKAITRVDATAQEQVRTLIAALRGAKDPEGVGLSFPQIGLNIRGFVTFLDGRIRVYLNPEVVDQDEHLTLGGTPERPTLEGCLSIPWLYGPIWRPKKIKVKAIDERGAEVTKTLSSFPARLFMHEYDHLEGVLFTDYTLTGKLPLFFLDRDKDKFIEIKDPSTVIKW